MNEENGTRSLAVQLKEREISNAQWHTLSKSLYPGAHPESVLMVIDYCRARKLDPLKKPCHIVPMKVGDEWRDVIMPGIYELRTTAQKTGEYLGHSVPVYGDTETFYEQLEAPSFCSFTVYRWNPVAEQRGEYPVTVWFSEVVATVWDRQQKRHVPNSRWSRAPRQMLTKCAEAAALREAFPDELGGEMSFEEMVGQPAIEDESQDRPETFSMSKQAETKIVRAMTKAIAEDDHGAIWEIYDELDWQERDYINRNLDRHRRSEWKKAIEAAAKTHQESLAEQDESPEAITALLTESLSD